MSSDFRPRPAPPPGRTAAPRPPRLNGTEPKPDTRQAIAADQYIRLQAGRLAVDRYRGKQDVSDDELLATARRFAEFIRTGQTTPERPDHA